VLKRIGIRSSNESISETEWHEIYQQKNFTSTINKHAQKFRQDTTSVHSLDKRNND
jgi:hypothetical protein